MTDLDNTPTYGRRSPFGGRVSAQQAVALEQLQELAALHQTMTAWAARMSGRMVNNTLEVSTRQFGADGVIAYEFGVAAGSVRVTPIGTNNVTVSAAPAAGVAPTTGIGVAVVTPANPDTIPLASTQFTLYGTAGDRVCVQVYAAGVTP